MYVHHIMGAKGGTGKTLLSTLMADHLAETGATFELFDASLYHHSLAGIQSLPVNAFMEPHKSWKFDIDYKSIDRAHESISFGARAHKHVLIDVGSHAFLAMAHGLTYDVLLSAFHDFGFQTIFHHIIPGGWNQRQTEAELAQLIREVPEPAKFIVWLNHHHGPVRAPLESLPDDIRPRILTTSELPRLPNHQQQTLHQILGSGHSLGRAASDVDHPHHIPASEIWPQFKSQIASAFAAIPPWSLPTAEPLQPAHH